MANARVVGPRARERERATTAIAAALAIMSRSPDRAGRALAGGLYRISRTEQQRMIAEWVKEYLAPGSPGAAYAARLTRQLHPNVRKRFLAGFIANLFFRDPQVSERLKKELGINAPNLLAISPSMRCNLRCTGCYAGEYDRKDDMPPELFDRILTEAESIGTRVFILIGGEPFMWPPLLDIISRHRDSQFQIYTNSSMLDDAMVERIVELGNIAPAVSIEGGREHTDARRGKGTYDKVIGAMARLRDAGVMFSYSATATRQNLDDITSDAFVDLMVELGAMYGWYFMYAPVGMDPDLELMLTPPERDRLRREVQRLRTEKPILLGDFWHDGILTGGCLSAGRKYVHINNKGDVEPCVFCHFAVDNLHDMSLVDALASDFFRDLRRMQPFGHNLLRPCPLIDHPGVIRGAVQKHGAYATHPGAESMVTDLQPGLREYATGVRDVFAPVWEEEYDWARRWLSSDPEWNRRHDRAMDAEEEMTVERSVVVGEPAEAEPAGWAPLPDLSEPATEPV